MKNITFKDSNGITWKQISKAAARKLYDGGSVIKVCAANLRPGFPYNPDVNIDKARLEKINYGPVPFDQFVNQFEFYNCFDSETGRYARFYKEA